MKIIKSFVVSFAALGLSACGTFQNQDLGSEAQNLPYPGGIGPQWVYNGALVPLERVEEVVVSIKGHTVRVTGVLPRSYDGSKLPYYAEKEDLGGQLRISVVYPIATARLGSFNDNGTPVRNATPKTNPKIVTVLRKTENNVAEWGGFPFLIYEPARAIGFHGPITHRGVGGSQWELLRGPVSHGCNRMQGEHTLELATLLGLNTSSKVYAANEAGPTLNVPVKVMALADGYDKYKGALVDVDYPGTSGMVRPKVATGVAVKLFKTWDGMKLTRYACQYSKASGLVSDSKCNHRPANQLNPLTGLPVGTSVTRR